MCKGKKNLFLKSMPVNKEMKTQTDARSLGDLNAEADGGVASGVNCREE